VYRLADDMIVEFLPPRRWRQSCFKRDSLRFSCDEISRVRVPYRTKIIGSRIGLGADQKLSRRLLEEKRKRESQVKLKT
jgi:hypothetical protein